MVNPVVIFVISVVLAIIFGIMIYNGFVEMNEAKKEVSSFEARGCTVAERNWLGDPTWWSCPPP